MHHRPVLREACAVMPPRSFRSHPGAQAVREILFPAAAPVPKEPPSNLPGDAEQRRSLAAGPRAADALRAAIPSLVVLRLRGDWDGARLHADRLEDLVETAQREQLNAVAGHVPMVQLQLGITHLVLGESALAFRQFARAFRNRHLDPGGFVGRDAAAKTALTHAVRGEADAADGWLDRTTDDEGPDTVWYGSKGAWNVVLESTELAAHALVAALRLDSTAARTARDQMNNQVIDEELWPYRLHALLRTGLLLGDALGAQRLAEEAGTALPYSRAQPTDIMDLILADRADLYVATGTTARAAELLASTASTAPAIELCRGRIDLLTGNAAGALLRVETAFRSEPLAPRFEIEGLVLAAIALERLGRRREALARLEVAGERAATTDSIAGFATVPVDELSTLAADIDLKLPADLPQLFPSALSPVRLSPRELVVLRHLAHGRPVADIAAEEFVSINTVRSQVRSIYRKLGANGRDEALRLARIAGLL